MDETTNPAGDEINESEPIAETDGEIGGETGAEAVGETGSEPVEEPGSDATGNKEVLGAESDAADTPEPSASDDDTGNPLQSAPELGVIGGEPETDIPPEIKTVDFPKLAEDSAGGECANLELLYDVQLPIAVELGRAQMDIADILDLGPGSVVELDKMAGEAVDLLVNGVKIGKGEVVVVDEQFGIRITQLISTRDRVQKLA